MFKKFEFISDLIKTVSLIMAYIPRWKDGQDTVDEVKEFVDELMEIWTD